MVIKVRVKILDEEGKVLEEGDARQLSHSTGAGLWEYVSQVEGKTVAAEACDLAGNVAKLVL
jgi:hypothetical protein